MNLYQSHIAERISCRVICICVGLLALIALPASAQVNGTGSSDSSLFNRVVNLPEDIAFLPAFDPATSIVPGGTGQINVGVGGTVEAFSFIQSGIELNVNGGIVGALFSALPGSEVNLNSGTIEGEIQLGAGSQANFSGGSFDGEILAESGSQINVNGGDFGGVFGIGAVEVNVSGGNFTGMFGGTIDANISGGSFTSFVFGIQETANISGGTFDGIEAFLINGTANISGGTFDGIDDFSLSDGGELNLVGSDFFLDGIALNDLTPGEATLISDRDAILSGLLSDGSSFEFDLNTTPGTGFVPQPQFFSPTATLTVSLAAVVPEPTSSVILSLAGFMALCTRRRN